MTDPKPRGRPPIPADQHKVGASIRLTVAQWAKLAKLGGVDWIRAKIDRAKVTDR